MSIGSGVPYNSHTGNGVTTTFAYGFTLLDADDLVVTINGSITSAYSVTGLGVAAGGTVVFDTAPSNGAAIFLQRTITLQRATDYQTNGDLLAETVNNDFDRLWMATQGVDAVVAGTVRAPYPETMEELPAAADRADGFLKFDGTGKVVPWFGSDPTDATALASDLASPAAGKGAAMLGRGLPVVDSIAELRALRKTDPAQRAFVTGYRAAGMGGGGHYYLDPTDTTTADDGGLTIVATDGGRWKLIHNGRISICQFGADPTYTFDSTANIQAAIKAGSWNGIEVYAENGTYRCESGSLYIGTDGTNNFYSVSLLGESAHGTVFMRPAGGSTDPIFIVNGFHNKLDRFTIIGNVSAGAYTATRGLYVRGNPQPGTNGLGTKYCGFGNIRIQRVGVGLQIGDYDVDGKDPDIETNTFSRIEIQECNIGMFANGQNILHNTLEAFHIVNCRDQLVLQKRGGDLHFDRSYFGGMYDFLTSSYNPASSSKVLVQAGNFGMTGSRSEDWASSTGNATSRFSVNVTSPDSRVHLEDNTFTTRDNATTEPSVSITGSGTAGSISTRLTSVNNEYVGYVSLDTTDVFDLGSRFRGTGAGVVNGLIRSANQKSQTFREVFMPSNLPPSWQGGKFTRNGVEALVFERPAVSAGSQWLGEYFRDEAGLLWGRIGAVVNNATGGSESGLVVLGNTLAGVFRQIGIGSSPAMPASGSYTAGDIVFNSSSTPGGAGFWKRLTTGSNHVLGTDWEAH